MRRSSRSFRSAGGRAPAASTQRGLRARNTAGTSRQAATKTGAAQLPLARPVRAWALTSSSSGTTLAFGSVSLSLSGTPASGDEFSVAKVASTFDVLGNFVTALNSGNPDATRFGGNQAIAGMDAAQESISRVRSGVGSRMVEVETQQNINGSLDLQYEETLSRLQDVDYAEAVSNLTQQKTYLEAAQQSFLKVSNLSLFNYL